LNIKYLQSCEMFRKAPIATDFDTFGDGPSTYLRLVLQGFPGTNSHTDLVGFQSALKTVTCNRTAAEKHTWLRGLVCLMRSK